MPSESPDDDDEWAVPTRLEPNPLAVEAAAPEQKVPTVVRCRECGGHLERIENWRPPEDADAAWRWAVECGFKCIATRGGVDAAWSFCPRTGIAWVMGHRVDFERRKTGPVPWIGDDRRRSA